MTRRSRASIDRNRERRYRCTARDADLGHANRRFRATRLRVTGEVCVERDGTGTCPASTWRSPTRKNQGGKKHRIDTLVVPYTLSLSSSPTLYLSSSFHHFFVFSPRSLSRPCSSLSLSRSLLVFFPRTQSPPINAANKNNERPPAHSPTLRLSSRPRTLSRIVGVALVTVVGGCCFKPQAANERGYRTLPRACILSRPPVPLRFPTLRRHPAAAPGSLLPVGGIKKENLSFDFVPSLVR